MEPADLTVRILQDIREDVRGLREEQRGMREEQRGMREEIRALAEAQMSFQRDASTRFEAIETTLRDLAEQLVMLARGVKVAIDQRVRTEERLDDHERRLGEIEKRLPA